MIIGTVLAVVAVLGALVWSRHRYVVITVQGQSMSPAYRTGDRLLVRRMRVARIGHGQCVVFAEGVDDPARRPVRWIVKRAVAVPGDPVPRDRVPALRAVIERHVPAAHLVVLGDSPAHSYDSRHYGYVTADRVLGVVLRPLTVAMASGSVVDRPGRG
jgi:signal peptidase I